MVRGTMAGRGTMTWADGSIYDGQVGVKFPVDISKDARAHRVVHAEAVLRTSVKSMYPGQPVMESVELFRCANLLKQAHRLFQPNTTSP